MLVGALMHLDKVGLWRSLTLDSNMRSIRSHGRLMALWTSAKKLEFHTRRIVGVSVTPITLAL